ncbi:HIT domain-containing protein [Candidatus Falkowbacteria bacterium]|nr:HIT domain-containing protein [Candidatus Falkowbacteria bacterium]
MEDCIFCKIVAGEISSYKVYEDAKVLAFFDILPISPGHAVVAPRRHAVDMENLTDNELCAMVVVMKKIGKAMMEGLGVKGYSIFLDNKDAANQHVPHVHFHVVPRKEGDGLGRWPQGGYAEGEAEEALKKITERLIVI